MKIGICDDNATDRIKLIKWLQRKRPDINKTSIFEFCSGEALLEYLRIKNIDILFLDGKMDGLNGIQTAGRLREYNADIIVIILSDYINYAVDGYGVDVFDYILKKDFQQRIPTVFNKAVQFITEKAQATYTVKLACNLLSVRVIEILYLESNLRKLKIVLRNKKTYEYYGKLDDAEADLKPHGFIRTHKSYLVNCHYVRYLEYRKVELDNGIELPVSQSKYKPALDLLTLFADGELL